MSFIEPFYNHKGYIDSFIERGKEFKNEKIDHTLFSFHGLPEKYLIRDDDKNHGCINDKNCCDYISFYNQSCYRAQCFKTSKLIAEGLKIKKSDWSISFQSRLGKSEWIKPYTENKIIEFARNGIKNLLIFCPAFVVSCGG